MTARNGTRVILIAEAGTSHRGDIHRARDMIDAAAESGADSIKFQWVIADEIVHPAAGTIKLHHQEVPLWQRFHELERPPSFYEALKEYSERRGLVFLCSPFGKKSARGLLDLGVDAVKIASPELNHYPLLNEVKHLPLLLSTGVSTLADIEESLDFIRNGGEKAAEATALLHCITAYPAPEKEYNLRLLPLLSRIFNVSVGVSDHSRHPLKIPLTALAMGAGIIEKHITLSRENGGLDDPIALEPAEFRSMCGVIREYEKEAPQLILEECRRLFGEDEVQQILGSGKKEPAPAERPFYGTTNRSVVALSDLKAGTILSEENTALLRSEQRHTPGLPPRYWKVVLGKILQRGVREAEGITWQNLLTGPPQVLPDPRLFDEAEFS